MRAEMTETDVLIVGAGIVGCAAAYYLARRGLSVRVLDRGRIGSEQSSRSWGFVRQQGRHVAEAPLAAQALRMWDGLAAELQWDIGFVRSGILVLAETVEDEERMLEGAREAHEHGVETRLLSPREISAREPQLAGGWRAGLLTEQDGNVEPIQATLAFAEAARRLGVIIQENTPVIGIETSAGIINGVRCASRVYHSHTVLCAAGIGAATLTRTIGISLPIQIVRACVAQTVPTKPIVGTAVWSPHVAFRPRSDGSFTIGNGYRGIDAEYDLTLDALRHLRLFLPTYFANRSIVKLHFGRPFFEALLRIFNAHGRFEPLPEPTVNSKLIRYNKQQFDRLIPTLRGIALARSWAGLIDTTPDLVPIIGAVDSSARYFVAAGFNGHGLALGPVVGRVLSELIADGKSSIDVRALRPQRFAEGDVLRRQGAL